MSIRIRNKTRRPPRMLTINLPKNVEHQTIDRLQRTTDRQGNPATRKEQIAIGVSVHIPSGQLSRELPDAAVNVEDVRRLLAKNEIEIVEVEEETPKTRKKSTEPASGSKKKTTKGTGPSKRKKRRSR